MTQIKKHILTNVDRINELELALTIFNSKRAFRIPDTNLKISKVGNSTLLIDTSAPDSIYFNRIKGFSLNDINNIDEILDLYYSKKITPCFDLTPNNISMEVAKVLMKKGFICSEQLAFVELEPYETNDIKGEIKIVKVTEQNVMEFIRLISLSNGMEIKQELAKKKAEYFYQPNFLNYIAYIGEEAAGISSLFIKGEEGYVANGFTYPALREKGVQKALLQFRIQVAKELGLKKLYSDVEFGSISHNNMLKLGFETIFINSFWMKVE